MQWRASVRAGNNPLCFRGPPTENRDEPVRSNHLSSLSRMTTNIVEQLGPDTIYRFERSAPLRLEEGDLLSKSSPLIAIYLYGYAAEMLLKAAYFKHLRFRALDEIDRDTRNRAMALARSNGKMNRDPHDIPGWARFLVWDKATLHTPAYEPKFEGRIVTNALLIYENWRPQMRYRNHSADASTVARVREAALWMVDNFKRM